MKTQFSELVQVPESYWENHGCPVDLRKEADELIGYGPHEWWVARSPNAEAVVILWYPFTERAGIAWGAPADWIDADSPQDAWNQYFGDPLSA